MNSKSVLCLDKSLRHSSREFVYRLRDQGHISRRHVIHVIHSTPPANCDYRRRQYNGKGFHLQVAISVQYSFSAGLPTVGMVIAMCAMMEAHQGDTGGRAWHLWNGTYLSSLIDILSCYIHGSYSDRCGFDGSGSSLHARQVIASVRREWMFKCCMLADWLAFERVQTYLDVTP